MASSINDEIIENVRQLIQKITNLEIGSEAFNKKEKTIITTLKKSDSMYFCNTKEINTAIGKMCEKFNFHGYRRHADRLQTAYDAYMGASTSPSDLNVRLSIVKFLLEMSYKPTTFFWTHPERFQFLDEVPQVQEEEITDWKAYLNEGIEIYAPPSDDSSISSNSSVDLDDSPGDLVPDIQTSHRKIVMSESGELYDFPECRKRLYDTIQHTWYNGVPILMRPPSSSFQANVGVLWEDFLQKQIGNLIKIPPLTVISEYKVMREVIWQIFEPHNGIVFEFDRNTIKVKQGVTIASVRAASFESFMGVFLKPINLLCDLRKFYKSVLVTKGPEVIRTYGSIIQKIIGSTLGKIVEIEDRIRAQETTITLLTLAKDFEEIFKPIYALNRIHNEIKFDFNQCDGVEGPLKLLTRLRDSLKFTYDKLGQDISLALYLECLRYYLDKIDTWLIRGLFIDFENEFFIVKDEAQTPIDWRMNLNLRDNIEEFCEKDGLIRVICEETLQISRNMRLLSLLQKTKTIENNPEGIFSEFIRRFLEELGKFYNYHYNMHEIESNILDSGVFEQEPDADWMNLVDISDGFLMNYMEAIFTPAKPDPPPLTLYERISQITASLYPLQDVPERILGDIMKERFPNSGLIVKDLLISKYGLDKQFDFLTQTFLCMSGLLSPFYTRLFKKMGLANSNWGNSVWLSSHLQDLLMDDYENFSENITVDVNDEWKDCLNSLEACSIITLDYKIEWPLNLIITQQHIGKYNEIFVFISQLKWALFTLNRQLLVADLKGSIPVMARLKTLRFNLINTLSNIQHYIFGYIFHKYRLQFILDFEKASDLKSIIHGHDVFLNGILSNVVRVRDCVENNYGYRNILDCVKMLRYLWTNIGQFTYKTLEECSNTYKMSYNVVSSIVNPVYVYDY